MTAVDSRRQRALRCSTVVVKNQQVLLVHRRRHGGDWVLPGGTPRPAESLICCARREVLEETGLHIAPNRIAFVVEAIDPSTGSITVDVVFLAHDRVIGQISECEPRLVPTFVPLEDLSSLTIRPSIAGHLRSFLTLPTDTAAY